MLFLITRNHWVPPGPSLETVDNLLPLLLLLYFMRYGLGEVSRHHMNVHLPQKEHGQDWNDHLEIISGESEKLVMDILI